MLKIKVECFNLKYTLECGQCFRWQKIDNMTYIGVIKDRVLKVKQDNEYFYITSNNYDNLEQVVKEYFDLNTDYKKIEEDISKIDNNIKEALKNTSGIRHLKQDYFETLISYIISANNNIPRISKSINLLSEKYGKKITFEDKDYYLFPTLDSLKDVSVSDYRNLGVGFRDNYIYSTVNDLISKNIDLKSLEDLDIDSLRNVLMGFKGVGRKVADCILLFAYARKEVFPIDVWVERVMSVLYFKENGGRLTKKQIQDYAKENFGKYAGIIQQHLFYNMRNGIIKQ